MKPELKPPSLSLGAREMGHAPVTHALEEGPVPQAGQLKLALHSPGLGKHRWVVGVRVGITTRLGGGGSSSQCGPVHLGGSWGCWK